MGQIIYKCPECGWQGTEDEMPGDFLDSDFYATHVCPSCGRWWVLDDYEITEI
jgi:predicted RNA-binding Zn-ribbon protein involved in translation (DUF1610 family)